MPPRSRAVDRGSATGRELVADLARELETTRLSAGLSYAELGRAVRITGSQVARICQGRSPDVSVRRLAQLISIVGMRMSARAYPEGAPIRDRAHVGLLLRFRSRVHPDLGWRTEVPVIELPSSGQVDIRSWDAAIDGLDRSLRVEAETRVHDLQALLRRLRLKQRDGRIDVLILALNDTRHHRQLLAAADPGLTALFPLSTRAAFAALRDGRCPPGNAVVLV